ncbi:helix-turn-helix domain-containing protein, partial [Vibrio parahaemolyticus]
MGNKPLNLRKARNKKDLTQEELAEKLGISR